LTLSTATVASAAQTQAAAKPPLTKDQVVHLLRSYVSPKVVAGIVRQREIDFQVTPEAENELRQAGATDELLITLREVAPKWGQIVVTAVPDAQIYLDDAFKGKASPQGLLAIGNATPGDHKLRVLLAGKGQYEQQVTVLPGHVTTIDAPLRDAKLQYIQFFGSNESMQHDDKGDAFAAKMDWDHAIAEYREAIRMSPTDNTAHSRLGAALGHKGDWHGDIAEQREAIRIDSADSSAHRELGFALGHKGDCDGAIAEGREAVRLAPNDSYAHGLLGMASVLKGDLDGALSECPEASRLTPNDAEAHAELGYVLEQAGMRQEALKEYLRATQLDPSNADRKRNYERLLRGMSPSSQ
jgi:Flp pilus assembly protein TadD